MSISDDINSMMDDKSDILGYNKRSSSEINGSVEYRKKVFRRWGILKFYENNDEIWEYFKKKLKAEGLAGVMSPDE